MKGENAKAANTSLLKQTSEKLSSFIRTDSSAACDFVQLSGKSSKHIQEPAAPPRPLVLELVQTNTIGLKFALCVPWNLLCSPVKQETSSAHVAVH